MNHLAGLAISPPASLGDAAEGALAEFRAAIDALEGAEAGGKPEFVASSAALPSSGWRPLDDWTLLRFLRADVRKGKVTLEASVARLPAALAWRRELALERSRYQSPRAMVAAPSPTTRLLRRLAQLHVVPPLGAVHDLGVRKAVVHRDALSIERVAARGKIPLDDRAALLHQRRLRRAADQSHAVLLDQRGRGRDRRHTPSVTPRRRRRSGSSDEDCAK